MEGLIKHSHLRELKNHSHSKLEELLSKRSTDQRRCTTLRKLDIYG